MNITTCRACGAQIVFMVTRKGKQNPVNLDSIPIPEGAIAAEYIAAMPATTLFDYNTHVSHFLTCPRASEFKKQNKEKPSKPKPAAKQDGFDWEAKRDMQAALDREDCRETTTPTKGG